MITYQRLSVRSLAMLDSMARRCRCHHRYSNEQGKIEYRLRSDAEANNLEDVPNRMEVEEGAAESSV
jgi:hypothetical protein